MGVLEFGGQAAGQGPQGRSLYSTFGGKDQLFAACLEHYNATVAADLGAALGEHADDPYAAVAAMCDTVLDRFATGDQPPGCLITQTTTECGVLSPALQSAVARVQQEQLVGVRQVLENGARAGRLLPDVDVNVDRLAAFVVGVAHALAVMHRGGADLETLRGVADTALSALPTAVLA